MERERHAPQTRASRKRARDARTVVGFNVLWCGSVCKDSPHATREDAEKWIADMHESARRARQPMYGGYTIRPVLRGPREREGREVSPEDAIRHARRLFPNAVRVFVYAERQTDGHLMNGQETIRYLPALVKVQTAELRPGCAILNQPMGIGPTLASAVLALTRCTFADKKARDAVSTELGGDDPTDGATLEWWGESLIREDAES